jgi:CRP-like cAMP-binding protein
MVPIPSHFVFNLFHRGPILYMITIMSDALEPLFHNSVARRLAAGETLFHTGDAVTDVFQVTAGAVALQRVTPEGAELTIQVALEGDVLAEASLYSPVYHCDAVALRNATMKLVAVKTALARLRTSADMAEYWASKLARSVQDARSKAEIRSLKTVSARLEAWIALGGNLPERGQYQSVATEIGVTREALYRELSQRRSHASS